ncbi:response regulator transcription factor [Phytohabitans rumicis]|uniref:DNA-binding response regulator n=1 Tax=Phytohabitans rumicis TaxID=1076125 RepID=A0A6V8KY62_9ACTN|nr:response regulator transcription factor [Phytohabitans rumicis]GFJ86767.1 DNA-binding response regulator [Phytohabitans rumicis]
MRVVVADDAALMREGLSALLALADLDVVATVADAHALLDAVRELEPDAVVVDIRMPPTFTTEGLVAAERIRSEHPATAVLVLSMHIEPECALALTRSSGGGIGYLLKERVLDVQQIVSALHQIAEGGTVIDPAVVDELLARRRSTGRINRLTPREQDVLALMAQGHTNRAIADRLHLSGKTVEAYVTSLLDRLEIHSADGVHRRVRAVLTYLHSVGDGPGALEQDDARAPRESGEPPDRRRDPPAA